MLVKNFLDEAIKQEWCVVVNNKQKEVVEFYDFKYKHIECDQFVSSYHKDTLLARDKNVGLNLNCGVPSWKISAKAMNKITNWLKEI